jgi:hypothetical protein
LNGAVGIERSEQNETLVSEIGDLRGVEAWSFPSESKARSDRLPEPPRLLRSSSKICPGWQSAMNTTNTSARRHAGPNPGIVAIVYALLFNAGLWQVISFTDGPHFSGPWESGETVAAYFQGHPTAGMLCAILQFGAAIALGIFTASMVSRLPPAESP